MSAIALYDYLERLTSLMRAWSREQPLVAELQPVQLSALHYLARCNRYSDTPLGVTEYLGLTKGTVSQSLKAGADQQAAGCAGSAQRSSAADRCGARADRGGDSAAVPRAGRHGTGREGRTLARLVA